jgi:dihydroorotate dehydrogenase (fumarate)
MRSPGAGGRITRCAWSVANDPSESGRRIERRFIEALKRVKRNVHIPVSVRLTAFHTSLAHFASKLEEEGADGFVLVHRFYEADIDIENLEPLSRPHFSDSRDLLLRLRWLAIISANLTCSLAASGGIHSVEDAVKAIMSGADCIQLCSTLQKNGIGHVTTLRDGLSAWLEKHEYDSIRQMRGSMNFKRIPDPKALSRAHYMHLINSWGSQ